ncbi:hypothetical protein IscW_ISCW010651 [Ixodes scapularis]|uniref:Uncharacterized protein n=1 Tax=Ixodes scapularis TaxID=6945 RepID=B7Q554_IXOSC|nr:hypothetical protein IscW_ISCW010651 [Ixodes scapularis]|eukprot:XP_002401483.1 hypothetical protein IscW_ISCW010651 [Ixodes scapularis]
MCFKGGSLLDQGPGPPLEQIAAEPYEMDVKPVQPYQVPVSYMRSLVSQLQATPSDINFFLELGRDPNDFLDILDNYQHGISTAIQLGNTLLGLLSLGGVLVVAGRFAGFCGDDDVQEASPLYNAFYTTTLGVTLFAAAVDVLLAFMLYQSSSDLSASINVLPSVKAMAVNDLAAFVKNTVQQKLVIAEREKRHRLEELEEHFHRGFSSYLKARVRKDMKLYEASEDAVVRITTIRSGGSPMGSIDRSDILEIRIPTPPAPEPPPPPRTPTHTVETVHIKIPPPAQPPPPVAAPPRQKVSTIEIHLPSQYLSQAQVPPPPPTRAAERTVSLIIGGTEGFPVARRSSGNTTMVHVDQASQKRITHHRLNPASWLWSLWYPFWGGGVHETAVRVSSSNDFLQ